MSNATHNTLPGWYKPVTITALVWNILGLMAFVMHMMMTPETLAQLPEAERQLYENAPAWLTIAFAIAVGAGTLGSLGLIMRKSWCLPVLVLSLLGVLAQNTHTFFLSNTLEVIGQAGMVMPIVVIIIAILLILLARSAKQQQWLD